MKSGALPTITKTNSTIHFVFKIRFAECFGLLLCLLCHIHHFLLFSSAETVIYRIFYSINRSGNGHLTLRELKRGNLIAALQQLDEEEDINKVLR